MASESSQEITALLLAWQHGEPSVLDQITSLVYGELHRLAHLHLRGERAGHTLQTTALVHEAYLRLRDSRRVQWQNRAHFFAVAASLMRRILVDIARERQAHKRGGEIRKVPLDEALLVTPDGLTNLLVLDDALTKLAHSHPRASQIFEMHYFSGLQGQEIAAVLDVSAATITQELKKARLWLQRELRGAGGNEHANGSVGSNH